jgi:hypothetical protein
MYQSVAERAAVIRKKYAQCKILALYTLFDALKLERILGTKRAKAIMEADQTTHIFDV